MDYELTATDSWAGISVALLSEQVDVAWMGPWGYVSANDASEILTGKALLPSPQSNATTSQVPTK